MVLPIIALLGFLFFGACAARADLDLTPTDTVQKMELMKIHRVVFHDGAKEITYQPPKGWTCNGSHNSAVLTIPDHPQARALIESAPHLRIPALDDKAQALFQKDPTLLQLPRGAKNLQITGVTLNPLVIDSHPTLEVQMTYSFYGQACQKSILLVDRNGAEVSMTLDCLAPDFDMLHKLFQRSWYTFENL